MRLFVSAGDISGDNHAARLVKELRRLVPKLEVYGIGGDRLREEGAHIYFHLDDLSVVGIGEVFSRLPAIWRANRGTRRILKSIPPDVVLLVDYPGFNLRLAKAAHRMGMMVVYYIAPQIWAWGRYRVRYMKRWVDKVITILPFEQDFYRRYGIDACFVGHPLLDAIDKKREEGRFIALLPGSRMSEIKNMLSLLLSISRVFPDEEFIIPLASHKHKDFVTSLVESINPRVAVNVGSTYEVLSHSKLAITASGTATLECAIIGVPLIIVYKGSPLTWIFARAAVDVPYIGLVNLVAGERIAPEFIQNEATEKKIVPVMRKLLEDEKKDMRKKLDSVRRKLGEKGASRGAAKIIAELIKQN
jgi:lipid-A-disaccharide synthase